MTPSTKPNARLVWKGRKKMKTVKGWALVQKEDGEPYSDHNGHPLCATKRVEAVRIKRIWFGGRLQTVRIARIEIREIKP
jgi:hypothetical protein